MTQSMPMISTIVDDSHVISTSVGTYCFSTSMAASAGRVNTLSCCE